MALTAREWKRFYAEERSRLGEPGLDALFDRAPEITLDAAVIFPHTRLLHSGHLVAAAARAVVRSGCDRVVALGVLHGAREQDAELVRRARAGDATARSTLRRIHGPGGHASDEFSLDNFIALVERAAHREGRRVPHVIARFPFLAETDPTSLDGFDELRASIHDAALVATTDPIHHGIGYGARDAFDENDPATRDWAMRGIERQLMHLARGDYASFRAEAESLRSDFRDVGPVLAALLRERHAPRFDVTDLVLVPYDDVLAMPRPTWVAAALMRAAVP